MGESRIVILGKTGAGKSSVANTIFGEELFNIGHTAKSDTSECRAETKSVNGRNITLIDTPGFFDTKQSEEELKSEIVRCITECAPGPHAFLIVLKVERYTEQEQAVINKINHMFSEEVFNYGTVLFTHGDQLKEGQTIEDFLRDEKLVSDLVRKCGGRFHVIDNTYWKNNQQDEYRSNQFQVKKLLKTIEQMIEANGGRCYTNEMLQAVQEIIIQEEEDIRQSAGNMSEEEIRKKARDRAFKRCLINLAGITTGALLGALFGVVLMVGVVFKVLKYLSKLGQSQRVLTKVAASVVVGAAGTAAAAGAAGTAAAAEVIAGTAAAGAAGTAAEVIAGTAAAGAAGAAGISVCIVLGVATATGAIIGGLTGYDAAQEANTPCEAAERAAKAFGNEALSLFNAQDNTDKYESESKPLISPDS